ncbi:MAG: GTP-binding protein [Thermodesulfovibrionales bacterium]
MKIVQIAGYLGSGKTTLIIALSRKVAEAGMKVAILVNDIGSVAVDGKVIEEYGLTVKDIGGGCICCQVAGTMIKTLETLAKGPKPDVIIIEPTGIAVPESIRQTVMLNAEKTGAVLGPTIVLFDTTRTDKLLTYDTLKRLVKTQIGDADIVALSKIDLSSVDAADYAEKAVREMNQTAKIIRLSTVTGEGLSVLADRIQEVTVQA